MIEINNLTKTIIDEGLLKIIGEKVLQAEKPGEEWNVSVAFVNKAKIAELNRIYRKKNESTDVLSFGGDNYPEASAGLPKSLGEIIICPSEIRFEKKIALLHIFVHGLLHLLGYDHENQKAEKIMKAKEQEYLTFFKE